MKKNLFSGISVKITICFVLIVVSFAMLLLPWIEISVEVGGQSYRLDTLIENACTYDGMSKTQFDLELQAQIAALVAKMSESGVILNTKSTLNTVQTILNGRLSLLDLTKIMFFANSLLSDLSNALTIQSENLTGSQRLALTAISDVQPVVMVSMILFSVLLIAAVITFILAIRSIRRERSITLIVFGSVQILLFIVVAFITYQANANIQVMASSFIDAIESILRMIGQYISLDTVDLFHITPWALICVTCVVAALIINWVKANFKGVNVDVSALGKWVCPKCRSQIKITNIYCDVCGCKRPEKPRCECGAELKEGVTYCGKCGKRVNVVIETPVYASPSAPRPAENVSVNSAPVNHSANTRICPRCGKPLNGNSLYCDSCQQSRSKLHGGFGKPTDNDL